jgi:hypothetical protein
MLVLAFGLDNFRTALAVCSSDVSALRDEVIRLAGNASGVFNACGTQVVYELPPAEQQAAAHLKSNLESLSPGTPSGKELSRHVSFWW